MARWAAATTPDGDGPGPRWRTWLGELWAQRRSVLGLYDPDRSQRISQLGDASTWTNLNQQITAGLNAQSNFGGAGLRLLTGPVSSPTEARLKGRSVVLLGSNNSLGLPFAQACIDASVEAVQRLGTGTTGSRIANGSFEGHLALEASLAKFYGRRHAMVFTTGYQANLGVLSSLVGRGDHLILDADSHASIYDGVRLGGAAIIRFRHNDAGNLERKLARLGERAASTLVIVEGLHSMLGDIAPTLPIHTE